MKKSLKLLKNNISNILFIFFVFAFSLFIFNNQSELEELFNFNFLNLIFLSILFIISYLIKTKLNQHLYLTKNINMSYLETLNLIINSTAGNLSTPFSAGTGYKFYYLKKNYKLTYAENLSINVYFTIFTNLLYLFILVIVSLINYLRIEPLFLNFTFLWISIFFIGIFSLFIMSREYDIKKLAFLNNYSLKSLDLTFSKIMNLFFYTLANIGISIASHIYLFKLLNLQINITQTVAFVCISGLANVIKFTPGNFGINESVLIIANLYHGLTALEVIITSFIFRFLSWLNILIFYGVLNIQKSYSIKNKYGTQ